jgi:hypothetical protein
VLGTGRFASDFNVITEFMAALSGWVWLLLGLTPGKGKANNSLGASGAVPLAAESLRR